MPDCVFHVRLTFPVFLSEQSRAKSSYIEGSWRWLCSYCGIWDSKDSLFLINFANENIKKLYCRLKSRGMKNKNPTASTAHNGLNIEIHPGNLAHQPSVYLFCGAERLEYIKGWQALIIFLLPVWNKLYTIWDEFVIEVVF